MVANNSKRIAKNTLILYIRMFITMLISLYTSRIVLNTLGVVDFGIYNVIGGVVSMFSFLSGAMSSSTQRFLSIEIGKNDLSALSKSFNTAFTIHITLALIIFVLAESIGPWFITSHLNIPSERINAANWVFQFSLFSFLVTIIQVPFNALIIAREKMNIFAYVSIIDVSLKLIVVFLLTWGSFDKLILYGLLLFMVTIIISSIYFFYTKLHYKETRFQIVKERYLYKEMTSYSGWSLFGSLSFVLKGQGINIILNIFFGPIVNAARGIAFQVLNILTTFVQNFQLSISPQIIKSFAQNDFNYMHKLIFRGSKYSYFLIFYLLFPLLLKTEDILTLWLKIVPENAVLFTQLVLINVAIDSITNLFGVGLQATGKIKTYQLIVGTLQLLNLPLSYYFFKLGYAPETTFYISIGITSIAVIVRLFITLPLIKITLLNFLKNLIIPAFATIMSSVFMTFTFLKIFGNNLLNSIVISFLCTTLCIFIIGITSIERKQINGHIRLLVEKILNNKNDETI